MANLKMTGAAMLTTVTTVAETLTNTVQAIGTGSAMLNNYVNDAKWRQEKQLKADRIGFEEALKQQKTVEIARSHKVLDEYIEQNPQQKELCDKIYAQLEEALA